LYLDSHEIYCRPSEQQKLIDHHGTPDMREAYRLDQARRDKKRRNEVAAIQMVRKKADIERKRAEDMEFAQPLIEALAIQEKEKAERPWLMVDDMDEVGFHREMRGEADVDVGLGGELPSYEASIEGRGEGCPIAPTHSTYGFEHENDHEFKLSPPEASELLGVKPIELTPTSDLQSLLDGPTIRLVFRRTNSSDEIADNISKRLLAAFSPFFQSHFARHDVSNEVVFLHLTGIEQPLFMLLYRWMFMVCKGRWEKGSPFVEKYNPDMPLEPLLELGADQSFMRRWNCTAPSISWVSTFRRLN
jgi:hypothetical protein